MKIRYKAKLTSKGQITIPAPVREALGLQPRERVVFSPSEKGEFRLRRVGSIKDMYGCLSDLSGPDLPRTNAGLDDLMAEIAVEQDEASKSDAQQNPDSERGVIGLDTNVVLRFYLNDHALQSPRARGIVDSLQTSEPGSVGLASTLEIAWVLKKRKGASRAQIADLLDRLLSQDVIAVEQAVVVGKAVQRFRSARGGCGLPAG